MISSRYYISLFAFLLASLVIFFTLPSGPDQRLVEKKAKSFSFEEEILSSPLDFHQMTREISPAMHTVQAWISSVGSSASLADLDHDGLNNDLCQVDPRLDLVRIRSLASPPNYTPITLSALHEAYYPEVMAPFGCLPGDLNEDGLTDLLVLYTGRPPLAFFQRDDLEFQPVEVVQTKTWESWIPTSAVWADLNGDSHQDLVIGCYFPDGTGLLDENSMEGEEMPHSMSRAWNGGRNRILISRFDRDASPVVQFYEPELDLEEHVLRGWTTALASFDMDQDGLSDLYFANNFGPDQLLRNRSEGDQIAFDPLYGRSGFTIPFSSRVGRDTFKAGGVEITDFNADSLPDILVSNIAHWKVPEANLLFMHTGEKVTKGTAPYINSARSYGLEEGGWGWDIRSADFNHDGELEILQANGFIKGRREGWTGLHELYWGNPHWMNEVRFWPPMDQGIELDSSSPNKFFVKFGSRYYDFSKEAGLSQPQNSRGVVLGDVEGDGDLDIVVANQWEDSRIYRNHSPGKGAFLGLRLLLSLKDQKENRILPGLVSSRDAGGRIAYGASAVVHIPGIGPRLGMVSSGNGHSGDNAPDIHVGLGNVNPGESVKVELRFRNSEGKFQLKPMELTPGWHTLVLGSL